MEMTREEAIRIIKIVLAIAEDFEITVQGEKFTEEKCKEAVDMAIEALEQEPCDDAISKQWLMECVNEGWIKFDTEKDKNRFIHLVRDIAPSVNPQPCGDLISRKTILEEFENDQYHLEFCKEHHIERSISMEMVRIRLHDLPPVNPQPKTGWILCSERLPEEKQAVLVWCPQYKNIYCAYLEKEQWWIFGAFVQIVPNEVIAWMPLPKPYKVESEAEE